MPSSTCSRCHKCGRCKSTSSQASSGASTITQTNQATLLGVDSGFLRRPKYHGSVYNVAFGRNYAGHHKGEIVAVKWVRNEHHCRAENHLANMRKVSKLATAIIYAFQQQVDTRGWTIHINQPEIWRSDESPRNARVVLVEPYIPKFTKFNSNTGWSLDSDRTYNKVMQALSHFSYVWSAGKYVLCDLQGGIREEDKLIIISDPTIMSTEEGQYGCTDMGKKGMSNFFKHHRCSSICRDFAQPRDRKIFFRPVEGTLYSEY